MEWLVYWLLGKGHRLIDILNKFMVVPNWQILQIPLPEYSAHPGMYEMVIQVLPIFN
jgi:hypothetical protein